jgi:cell shape-determining protein MreC
MKPDILKQKIESMLSQIDSMEFLEELRTTLLEQLEKEKRETRHVESLKRMNKRLATGSKKR